MVINQLIKFIWKVANLDNSLTYILGGKGNYPTENDQDKVQIWSFKSPQLFVG
jgi:hypothetical protein